jgi:hypothetical protein
VPGWLRAFSKNRCSARVCAIGLGLALWPLDVLAQSQHVGNHCPRLSATEYEELDARVLLLLKGEAGPHSVPSVVCTKQGSWVEWDGERLEIVGRGPISDEVVDLVEARLHDAERKADADPRTAEASAVASGQPMLERGAGTAPAPPAAAQPSDPRAFRAVDARGGGIAIGIETELPSDGISVTSGPTFDFGTSAGPLLLGGREAFRFGGGNRQVVFMDFEGLIAYGAPLDPSAKLGGVVRFGAEWMVTYPEGNAGQAAATPMVDIGLRAQHSFGVVAIWLGVDAHFRLRPLRLGSYGGTRANDVGGTMTIGVAFVDWSRR